MTCDACGCEWIGRSRQEALDDGWKIRAVGAGREFVMCGDCEGHYALVWALREEVDRRRTVPRPRPGR